MAVVNISLITDYDSGVVADTEAVTAHSVIEVFQKNSARIRSVVLDLVASMPEDLDSLFDPDTLRYSRGDGRAPESNDIRQFDVF